MKDKSKPASNFILLFVSRRCFCCGSYCLCLGVEFCAVCTLCAFSYFELGLGNSVATYWEIVAHSAYNMFS